MNLENAGPDSTHTVPGIPSLPLARGLLILALVQIGLKNKKGREKYYAMFFFSLLPFPPFSYHMYWNSAGERNYSSSPQNT